MIDNKPFRVTNEELNMLEEMSDAEIGEKMGLVKFICRLSADLKDARELIDKQEVLLKEMSEEIGSVVAQESTPTTKGELVYISNFTEMRDILEKTKDYA